MGLKFVAGPYDSYILLLDFDKFWRDMKSKIVEGIKVVVCGSEIRNCDGCTLSALTLLTRSFRFQNKWGDSKKH